MTKPLNNRVRVFLVALECKLDKLVTGAIYSPTDSTVFCFCFVSEGFTLSSYVSSIKKHYLLVCTVGPGCNSQLLNPAICPGHIILG